MITAIPFICRIVHDIAIIHVFDVELFYGRPVFIASVTSNYFLSKFQKLNVFGYVDCGSV